MDRHRVWTLPIVNGPHSHNQQKNVISNYSILGVFSGHYLLSFSLRSLLLPLDLLRRLGHEEADHVGGDLVAARVDGDLGVAALCHLRLDRQQQQLQLHKTQPEIVWR